MDATVTLKHGRLTGLPALIEPFYDGFAVARYGLLTLPANEVEHLRAAYFRGYQFTPEGEWLRGFTGLNDYIDECVRRAAEPNIETQTAESAEVLDESFDGGRQPYTDDRVRSRQRKSRTKATK